MSVNTADNITQEPLNWVRTGREFVEMVDAELDKVRARGDKDEINMNKMSEEIGLLIVCILQRIKGNTCTKGKIPQNALIEAPKIKFTSLEEIMWWHKCHPIHNASPERVEKFIKICNGDEDEINDEKNIPLVGYYYKINRNNRKAEEYHKKGWANGNVESGNALALIYMREYNDKYEAKKLFEEIYQNTPVESRDVHFYEAITNLAVLEELSGNSERSLKLLTLAAENNNPAGMYNLAMIYSKQERNVMKMEWLRKGTEHGCNESIKNLCNKYFGDKNYQELLELVKIGQKKLNPESFRIMGVYHSSHGPDPNPLLELRNFIISAALEPVNMSDLAHCFYKYPYLKIIAINIYEILTSNFGNSDAMMKLYKHYKTFDKTKADEYLMSAFKAGNKEAQNIMFANLMSGKGNSLFMF